MKLPLPNLVPYRWPLIWGLSLALVLGVFFLGLFLINANPFFKNFRPQEQPRGEVFGFAPYWTLDKISGIDWSVLTTFAYFSLPVRADGTLDRSSWEWRVFGSQKLKGLMAKAGRYKVRRVVTLTQMEAGTIDAFLANEEAWKVLAQESLEVIRDYQLDGVNIDFEYIPANGRLKEQFSRFMGTYSRILEDELPDPYITVSVLASSVRFNKIYDIGYLAQVTDGVFMMAYDFYYPGSGVAGPVAPLYGYNEGKGPFWYDVSTAVSDFLSVAPANKVILGIPYYGWTYPAYEPAPKSAKVAGTRAFATPQEKLLTSKLLMTTPVGGWDSQAQMSWRGFWDKGRWHVLYLEDERSLSAKLELARGKNLQGVGIWALGYAENSFYP